MMSILQLIFGCQHSNLSVPFTMPARRGKAKHTYKVCLDCTRQIPYNLKTFTTSFKPRKRKASKPYAVAYARFIASRDAARAREAQDNQEMETAQQ
jgi:hypothetical protein